MAYELTERGRQLAKQIRSDNSPEYKVLGIISLYGGRAFDVEEIIDYTHLPDQDISNIIRRMKRKGLIQESVDGGHDKPLIRRL